MALKRVFFLVPLMLLTLSGCFREASDELDALPRSISIAVTPTIGAQTVFTTEEPPAEPTDEVVVAQEPSATPTLEDLH